MNSVLFCFVVLWLHYPIVVEGGTYVLVNEAIIGSNNGLCGGKQIEPMLFHG